MAFHSAVVDGIHPHERHRIRGVEVRVLPDGHVLHNEYGLFTTQRFERFDVIGEYTGCIVGAETDGGRYVAILEDKPQSLCIDANDCGNETRFINSYLNISAFPNVEMKTLYSNKLPHIIIVCLEVIGKTVIIYKGLQHNILNPILIDTHSVFYEEPNTELLLDYGEEYHNAYLKPTTRPALVDISESIGIMDEHQMPTSANDIWEPSTMTKTNSSDAKSNKIRYLSTNHWKGISASSQESCQRHGVKGVEVLLLERSSNSSNVPLLLLFKCLQFCLSLIQTFLSLNLSNHIAINPLP